MSRSKKGGRFSIFIFFFFILAYPPGFLPNPLKITEAIRREISRSPPNLGDLRGDDRTGDFGISAFDG